MERDSQTACKLCRRIVPVKRGNTSNLRAHLATSHPAVEAALAAKIAKDAGGEKQLFAGASRQIGVAEAYARVTKYSKDSTRHKYLTEGVTTYLVEAMVPFNTVTKQPFKNMLQRFDKQYELPGKTYFSDTSVIKRYDAVKAVIKRELKDVDYFSATTDIWSSVNMTPYMSFTVHYLTEEWAEINCLVSRQTTGPTLKQQ